MDCCACVEVIERSPERELEVLYRVSIPGKVPTTPFHSDDANDANCISCITTPQKSPPTQPQKTFPRCTLLPQHVPSLRVPFAGHPPPDPLTTHFVRQAQLSWRLLRRLAFVIYSSHSVKYPKECFSFWKKQKQCSETLGWTILDPLLPRISLF